MEANTRSRQKPSMNPTRLRRWGGIAVVRPEGEEPTLRYAYESGVSEDPASYRAEMAIDITGVDPEIVDKLHAMIGDGVLEKAVIFSNETAEVA